MSGSSVYANRLDISAETSSLTQINSFVISRSFPTVRQLRAVVSTPSSR